MGKGGNVGVGRLRAIRSAMRGFCAAALCAGVAGLGGAAEIPRTAYSQSLTLSPVFLDSESLIYQFPQQAARFPGQILLSRGPSSEQSVLAMAAPGVQRWFLLVNPLYFADSPSPFLDDFNSAFVQFGWAAEAKPFRIGLAARGAAGRSGSEDLDVHYRNGQEYEAYVSANDSRWRAQEVAFGIGLDRGRAVLDVLMEGRWEALDQGAVRERTANQITTESSVVGLHHWERPMLSGSLRAVLPLGDQRKLTAAGDWGGTHHKWDALVSGFDAATVVDSFAVLERYQDAWSAGCSYEIPTGHLDRIIVAALYDSWRLPAFETRYYYAERISTSTRRGSLGLSAIRSLRPSLTAFAGFRSVFEYSRTIRERIEGLDSYSHTESRSEDLTHGFAWGARYVWKDVTLTGAVSTDLRLDNPFTAVDLRYSF